MRLRPRTSAAAARGLHQNTGGLFIFATSSRINDSFCGEKVDMALREEGGDSVLGGAQGG